MTRRILKFVTRKFQLDWKNWELDEPTFGMEWRCYEPVVLLLRENLVYLARPAKQMKKLNY